MIQLKRIFGNELLITIIIGVLGITFSFLQTIYDLLHVPSGYIYPLVHNYSEDYYYYLHLMGQGWYGHLTATSWLTPEIFPPRLVNPLFLILGMLSRILSIGLPQMYTLARLAGGIALFSVCVLLVRRILNNSKTERVGALILLFFGGVFIQRTGSGIDVPYLVKFWTELDPLVRFSFIPHHLFSKVFMVATYVLLLSNLTKNKKLFLLVITTTICGFSSPVVLSTFLPAIFGFMIFDLLVSWVSKRRLTIPQSFLPALTVVVTAFIVSLYHYFLMHDVFPWTTYNTWEKENVFLVTPVQFLSVMGPMFFLALLAIPTLIKRSSGRLLLSWIYSSWIMIFILGRFLPLATHRFLTGYEFIPLSIGAVTGIRNIPLFLNLIKINTGKFSKIFLPLIVGLLILMSVPEYFASMKLHEWYWGRDCSRWEICFPKPLFDGIMYLKSQFNTGGTSVILARYPIAEPVAVFTGQRVVAGHFVITYDVKTKQNELNLFFSYTDPDFSQKLLSKYNVAYVFSEVWGDNPEFMKSLGLRMAYENPAVRIYKR